MPQPSLGCGVGLSRFKGHVGEKQGSQDHPPVAGSVFSIGPRTSVRSTPGPGTVLITTRKRQKGAGPPCSLRLPSFRVRFDGRATSGGRSSHIPLKIGFDRIRVGPISALARVPAYVLPEKTPTVPKQPKLTSGQASRAAFAPWCVGPAGG